MSTKLFKYFILFLLTIHFSINEVTACQCPLTTLSRAECDKYEVIFRGKILSVKPCEDNFGEAVFEISELYKGLVTKNFKVLFECGVECSGDFAPGQEWIIYSNYKQVNNVKMDWCSRSRKYFKIDKEDYYKETYGNDYDDEVSFLRTNLGQHRFLSDKKMSSENRNKRPNKTETIIILVCSLAVVIAFYWLFNKFFKF